MSYKILIIRRAQKELSDVPRDVYPKVKEAIIDLAEDPRPTNASKLVSRNGWRLRVGNYRVIYEIDDPASIVNILHVGHRRDVYR